MRVNRAVYLNTLRWFLDSPARLMAAGLMAFLAYLAPFTLCRRHGRSVGQTGHGGPTQVVGHGGVGNAQ